MGRALHPERELAGMVPGRPDLPASWARSGDLADNDDDARFT
jgi:hypothetical protein